MSCLLAIDKPLGLTSHDVVGRLRRILHERRIGHAGTLDPDASGVLVVGVGQATRLLGLLTLDDKRYDACIAFGTETTTDDAAGQVIRTCEVPERLGERAVAEVVVASLVGPCEQVPPAYSAISVDGKRAYERARSGEEVDLPTRQVIIHEAELTDVEATPELVWDCSFHVSKGTYVRSIARDLGRSLGTAAHLCGLRRTWSGSISLDQSVSLDDLEGMEADQVLLRAIDPAVALGLPVRTLTEPELADVTCGRRLKVGKACQPDGSMADLEEGGRVSLIREGRLYGVWQQRGTSLASVATFPDGIMGVSI